VAVVLFFVGAGAVGTDRAGKFSELSPEGAAEVAAELAAGAESAAFDIKSGPLTKRAAEFAAAVTGGELPVTLEVRRTAPNSFLLSLKGAAEVASEAFDGEPSFVLVAA